MRLCLSDISYTYFYTITLVSLHMRIITINIRRCELDICLFQTELAWTSLDFYGARFTGIGGYEQIPKGEFTFAFITSPLCWYLQYVAYLN